VQRTLFGQAPPGTSCVGFKEIRYFQMVPAAQLNAYLSYLAGLFPNPAFLINLRNHDDVVQSGWWRKHGNPASLRSSLQTFEQALLEWAATKPERAFVTRYEDIVSKGPTLMGMYNFLGASFDPVRYEAVLAMPHSYDLRPKASSGSEAKP
jgi:hypothetical protein